MSHFDRDTDPAFQSAGLKPGLEIWCLQNHRLVWVSKSSHGKFYSGSAYVVLHTVLLKSGAVHHDIHYWLGNDATEVDSVLASDKSLELDAFLGSYAVQYREVQGQESEKFLSYFKPCIIPVEGVFASGPGQLDGETYLISLLTCKGDRAVHVNEVPFSRSSLNHNDVFILDTASKIFLFSGCNSSIQERAKALEVVQYIKENKHGGNCEVATIEDGKFVADPNVGEFWSFFGGYAPIPRDMTSAEREQPEPSTFKLFWISSQRKLCETGSGTLNRQMLDPDKCYMLDSDTDVYVWMGRSTNMTERKASISAAEDFLRSQRSIGTHLTFLTEGSETALFRSYFEDWPQMVEPKLYEEGRGKVAAIFKQRGYDVKELPDDDSELCIDLSGKLKVWRVDGDNLFPLPVGEQRKIFSGDCYIVQYTYPAKERDEYLLYVWIGRSSSLEDRADVVSHMNSIVDSMKGDPVLAQIYEDEEPILFFSIFQTLIVFKGGLSIRYKKSVVEKGVPDETYDEAKTALFRVQGTSPNNMQAIQVDQVSRSLNSSYCYILKTETSVFAWLGNFSSALDHDLLDRMLDLINPTWQSTLVREGSEPDAFWNSLGEKEEYPKEKESRSWLEDPRLFTCIFAKFRLSNLEDLQVKEIFNFTQDDLTTEDVFILHCHCEIYVWIGHNSNIKSTQEGLMLGLKFLKQDVLGEGLSLETPVYVVMESYEPPFFTRYFDWDSSKANMLGNSFERKLAIMKGEARKMEARLRSSRKAYAIDTTPDSLKSQSVSPNGWGSSSSVSVSSVKSANSHQFSSPIPITRKLFSESLPDIDGSSVNSSSTARVQSFPSEEMHDNQSSVEGNLLTYPYEQLKVGSNDPIPDIDVTKREAYLSNEEFQEKFRMPKRSFYQLPKWRQNKLKISLHLF